MGNVKRNRTSLIGTLQLLNGVIQAKSFTRGLARAQVSATVTDFIRRSDARSLGCGALASFLQEENTEKIQSLRFTWVF